MDVVSENQQAAQCSLLQRLNPCCDGRWSRTGILTEKWAAYLVLILVLMEDGL